MKTTPLNHPFLGTIPSFTPEDIKENLAGKTSRVMKPFQRHLAKVLKSTPGYPKGTVCFAQGMPNGRIYLVDHEFFTCAFETDAKEGVDFEFV